MDLWASMVRQVIAVAKRRIRGKYCRAEMLRGHVLKQISLNFGCTLSNKTTPSCKNQARLDRQGSAVASTIDITSIERGVDVYARDA